MTSVAERVRADVGVESLEVRAYRIPSDGPGGREADGTLEWDSTTAVVVEAHAGGETGLGYTYAHEAAALLAEAKLVPVAEGRDAFAVRESWEAMAAATRNAGQPGIVSMALSAVDIALWDLKARLLGLPLADLLDRVHDGVPVYGSGGFTNYCLDRLAEQLAGWVENGIQRVKLKTSRHPGDDPKRLDAARRAIGDGTELYADANGALTRKEALYWAERFAAEWDVTWFEEPVSSDDLEGLRLLRDRGPARMDIAAGEYAFVLRDTVSLLEAGAVDCLQLDVTRCGGITGLLRSAAAADAYGVDVSAHCAPAVSVHAFTAVRRPRHLEWFHDHVRVEELLFDGVTQPEKGVLRPDRSRSGHGLELKREDAAQWLVYGESA